MDRKSDGKPETRTANPEELARQLEMELALKRSSRQCANERRKSWRGLAVLFLFVIIVLTTVALYIASSMRRPPPPDRVLHTTPTATP